MSRVRPRWWAELLLLVVVYAAYAGARLLARGDVGTAVENGTAILRWERTFSLNAVEPLNRLFTEYPLLGIPCAFFYAALHYLVTPAVLVWLFRRRPFHYRLMRTWLMLSTLLGLVGFTLLPTSPPRLLADRHGFVDSLAQYSAYGWWSDSASAPSGLGDLTNQYAAMPSLHVGWAVWCGAVLWLLAPRATLLRALAVGYPLLTVIVVLGTANHYLLDAVAGVAVMAAGLLLARPAMRLADRARDALAGAAAGAGRPDPWAGSRPTEVAAAGPGRGPAVPAVAASGPREERGPGPARHNGPLERR
ncbi:phosphatase PAP2 family protein [Streptomyces sp. ACA25]|uniref:phosphatase PAP2 family protein n=1 Tax=Streptomyces sp. ACA25 TaxID=3022596 RepID=UPI002307FC0A|nr:phosphatase PAP2 family protein [Streptomyces sp. ACA25]MDB1089595.1 phosphatase PAP2 family protein [Streptomyces sp. ACA25]